MTNPEDSQDFSGLLQSFESFKKSHGFKTYQEIRDKLFPDKNDRYLSNGIRDLSKGKNFAFAKHLEDAMNTFDENPNGIHISDHAFYAKLNQRQNKPFTDNEVIGTVGKYLMFSIYKAGDNTDLILLSSFEIFKKNLETNHYYDSFLSFKANRINRGYNDENKKIVDIKTNGLVMKNSTNKLICHGKTNYADAIFFESISISDFGNTFKRNKTGIWQGVSFTHNQKIFVARVVLVKIIGSDLEKEFEKNRKDLIRYHKKEDLESNSLIRKIIYNTESDCYTDEDPLKNILLSLKYYDEDQAKYIILDTYD